VIDVHPLQEMIEKRKKGILCGIPSYCSANELVLEVILERAKAMNQVTLIEATANQVNQFGGYTGMRPRDFKEKVLQIAERVGCPKDLIILGGDHLGPLIWANESETDAMAKAKELVCGYIAAGYTKIHLDTSMKLGDDSKTEPLKIEVIARRGVELYQACMEELQRLQDRNRDALSPVFVIGSEVPIPGGAQEVDEGVKVTAVEDFEETVRNYKSEFLRQGFPDGWHDVIAIVVQPGVEFGDEQVFFYDKREAAALCDEKEMYPEIVFEGHSTDYQTAGCLREMVEDGIAILKVGPALTFGLREGLFALSMIERELFPKVYRSDFIKVLEAAMLEEPKNWINHYQGDKKMQKFSRKYSYSDRSRYYLGGEEVVEAMDKLFKNLARKVVPMSLLHQFMPVQYEEIRAGKLTKDPRALVKSSIYQVMKDYEFASTSVG